MSNKIRYINRYTNTETETVDQFSYNTKEERKYVQKMVKEYRLSDCTVGYALSQKCCKDWK